MKFLGKLISLATPAFAAREWDRTSSMVSSVYLDYRRNLAPDIPQILIETLIAAEDHRFRKHGGVDPVAILRAIWRYFILGAREGGSTIEQQLVRTVTRRYKRNFRRKAVEILLASRLDSIILKEDIPGVYLHVAYFGWRMTGVRDACRRLKMNLADLTPDQAAAIVARLKYPQPKNISTERLEKISRRIVHIATLLNHHRLQENREYDSVHSSEKFRTASRTISATNSSR